MLPNLWQILMIWLYHGDEEACHNIPDASCGGGAGRNTQHH